jgi:hypothetical protein
MSNTKTITSFHVEGFSTETKRWRHIGFSKTKELPAQYLKEARRKRYYEEYSKFRVFKRELIITLNKTYFKEQNV